MIVPHYITVLVQKFNENHDPDGRFGTGDDAIQLTGHFERPATAGKAATSDAKNKEVAARIKGDTYTTEDGREVALSSSGHWRGGLRVVAQDKSQPLVNGESKNIGSMIATPFDSDNHYTISMINVDRDFQRQGVATAMLEYGRAKSDLPIEHSISLTDDGAKFTQVVKGYYMTGPIRKDMLGDHIPQVIGTIPPIRPTGAVIRKPKAPKRAEVSVKKYNDNHDENGRFSESDGGSKTAKYGSGIATPEMQAQINEHGKKAKDRLNEHPPRRAPFAPAIATQAMQDQINERGRTTATARARMDERKATGVVIRKFNENHDELGRFSEGDGGVSAATASVHDTAVANEPAITAQMQSLADKNGGTMVGLDYRLKSTDSLSGKIARDSQDKGITPQEAGNQVSDPVRYTMEFSPEDYTDGSQSTINDLQNKGYDLNVKNYWTTGDPYQGINIASISPSGQKFELQFHTAQSFDVKQNVNHPLYAEFRSTSDASTRLSLWNQMTANAASIAIPNGVRSIPSLKSQKMG